MRLQVRGWLDGGLASRRMGTRSQVAVRHDAVRSGPPFTRSAARRAGQHDEPHAPSEDGLAHSRTQHCAFPSRNTSPSTHRGPPRPSREIGCAPMRPGSRCTLPRALTIGSPFTHMLAATCMAAASASAADDDVGDVCSSSSEQVGQPLWLCHPVSAAPCVRCSAGRRFGCGRHEPTDRARRALEPIARLA